MACSPRTWMTESWRRAHARAPPTACTLSHTFCSPSALRRLAGCAIKIKNTPAQARSRVSDHVCRKMGMQFVAGYCTSAENRHRTKCFPIVYIFPRFEIFFASGSLHDIMRKLDWESCTPGQIL